MLFRSLGLAATTTVDTAVRFASDVDIISTSLASLSENAGSGDPLSLLGRLIVGEVNVHTTDAIAAIGAGDLETARSKTGSALFSRDSAWLAGSGVLLLIAAIVLWMAYRTPAGKKRMQPVLAKVRSLLRR